MIKWTEGEPPKDNIRYLYMCKSGIIGSGSYRHGNLGEPQQGVKSWRLDCCGRFSNPAAWATINYGIKK